MGKMTFVVEFEDGKEPPFQFTDDFMGMGGKLCSVSAFDYKDDLLTEDEVSAIQGLLSEHERDFESWCNEYQVEPEEIERKLNLMG